METDLSTAQVNPIGEHPDFSLPGVSRFAQKVLINLTDIRALLETYESKIVFGVPVDDSSLPQFRVRHENVLALRASLRDVFELRSELNQVNLSTSAIRFEALAQHLERVHQQFVDGDWDQLWLDRDFNRRLQRKDVEEVLQGLKTVLSWRDNGSKDHMQIKAA